MKVAALILFLVAVASADNTTVVLSNSIAPYIVSIGNLPISNDHACAGTIINKDWILTTGSCVYYLESRPSGVLGLPVYAGVVDLGKLDDAQMRRIDFAFKHKKFTEETGPYDIALLHVSEPFEFSASVKSAVLPAQNEEYKGMLQFYSWGKNDTGYNGNLMKTTSVVMDAGVCQLHIPAYGPEIQNNVCLVIDNCYGIRGSPLVMEREGDVSELVGMASWSYLPCAFKGRPTALTSVANYLDWIVQVQWAYYILY